MRERFSIKIASIGLLLFVVSMTDIVAGQDKKVQAWETPGEVSNIIWKMSIDLEPTLPAPRLVPEPPYTWGLNNTVYWYGDSVRTLLDDLGMRLLFFEIKASYDQTELWGFVSGTDDSAVFAGLPENIPIEYRLRYFTQNSAGEFFMSHWSEPTWSIQDNSPPILTLVEILNLQVSGDIKWVNSATIYIRVQAIDSLGQVMEVVIHERSDEVNDTLYYSIVPPKDAIDETIVYTIQSPEHMPITIQVWVVDVSGQKIGEFFETFFWWKEEGDDERMICFPNPFNPEDDEKTIIKINNPNVNEACIFDPFGNLVRILQKKSFSDEFFEWDGRNGRGRHVSTGGYLCVAKGHSRQYCKIAVLR